MDRRTIDRPAAIRAGQERARALGVHLGRPPKASTPSASLVRDLRRRGLSWRRIAAMLNCPIRTVRRLAR